METQLPKRTLDICREQGLLYLQSLLVACDRVVVMSGSRSAVAALPLLFMTTVVAFAQCINPTTAMIVRGTGTGSSRAVLSVSADAVAMPYESRATAGADFALPSGVPEVEVSVSLASISGKSEVWTPLPGFAKAELNATLTVTRGERTVCASTLELDKRIYFYGYKSGNLSNIGTIAVTCRGNLNPDDQTTPISADLVLFSEAKAGGLGAGARVRYSANVSFSMQSCS